MTKSAKRISEPAQMAHEVKEEFFFRAHSGWIEGSHVLSEVWEDYPGLTEQINLPGPSWELPFRERGMVIGDDGDSWWVRWHDAYELIREFKGAEAAARFIEQWMDIADREGYVGMYGDRVRRSFGHPVGPVAILE